MYHKNPLHSNKPFSHRRAFETIFSGFVRHGGLVIKHYSTVHCHDVIFVIIVQILDQLIVLWSLWSFGKSAPFPISCELEAFVTSKQIQFMQLIKLKHSNTLENLKEL